MKVEQCFTSEVFTCRPETDLEWAARSMWEHDCGCLPVVGERGEVVGMLTDRDVCMGAFTQGRTLRELSAGSVMSKAVFACAPDDSLEHAVRVMSDHQVHRLPVLDADGRLLGILSLNDVVRGIVALPDARARTSLTAVFVEGLAAICEPRRQSPSELEVAPVLSGTAVLAGTSRLATVRA